MTDDLARLKQRFFWVLGVDMALALIAVAFMYVHLRSGADWALYAFFGFIAAAFAIQLWFVYGLRAMKRGG